MSHLTPTNTLDLHLTAEEEIFVANLKLTPMMRLFCDEYLVDLNAKRAAQRAGYSEKTSGEMGYENLGKPNIQAYIAFRQKKRMARLEISQDAVLQEFAKIAFVDIREFYDKDNNLRAIPTLNDRCAAALAGMDVEEIFADRQAIGQTKKIKLHNKIAALDALGKHTGIFEKDNSQKGNLNLTVKEHKRSLVDYSEPDFKPEQPGDDI